MINCVIQIFLGIILANLYEWVLHKHVLHGLGKKKKSFFSSHWNTHHNKARKNEYFDEDYLSIFSGWNEGLKEIIAIFFLSLLQIPTILIFPYYSVTMILMGILYFAIHRKSHLNPVWAQKWVPWHYDHHMGKSQDANWCVTFPLWDYILGTRQKMNRPAKL